MNTVISTLIFCIFILSKVSHAADEAFNVTVVSRPSEAGCTKSKPGDILSFHYLATLDGKMLDSTRDQWDEALADMCLGEIRQVVVPPSLGYGSSGVDHIVPADATIVFTMELMQINTGPKLTNLFKAIDSDADEKISNPELRAFVQKQIEVMIAKNEESPNGSYFTERFEKVMDEILAWDDRNKDGFIALNEFSGPKIDL